ncbi:MAG: DUF2157 domain-containing protein [Ginsengibacter sp.]
MDIRIFKKLLIERLITHDEFEKIQLHEQEPVSVHWDLRTLLYLGIVLLTTSLSILVYKNIDTIGHDVIVIAIALLCTACFWYSFKNANGYSNKKITSSNTWFDYILLMGCLLLLTFVGYLQFEYEIFGNRWGLATFIPMVPLFIAAYYFDHLGVLSLAIVTLATWIGISMTQLRFINDNDFGSDRLIYSAIIFGYFLIAVAHLSVVRKVKAHFSFTYKNFGVHILMIGMLTAMFSYDGIYMLWFLLLAISCYLLYRKALVERSFYFLVVTILYAYVALSYVMIRLLSGSYGEYIYTLMLYFIFSGISLIWIFMHYNKKLKNGRI